MEYELEKKLAMIERKKQSLKDAIEEAIRAIKDPNWDSPAATALKLRLAGKQYGLEIREGD